MSFSFFTPSPPHYEIEFHSDLAFGIFCFWLIDMISPQQKKIFVKIFNFSLF